MGINGKGGQDWWVLCTSTPLVWGHVTYKRPTHCEEQVSGFLFESFTSHVDVALMLGRGKESCNVGHAR